ncbi:MAG TPA: hypothetical protein GXX19_01215 [Syntrophomonadaceae bacterium]|nr:hypothetical protein [Syntrophomonadaceae bacterium]
MYLTVRQIMDIGPLQRSRIISGMGGLDNIVKTVTVMDVPNIENWLKGNEFVLTNVFAIKDDIVAQKQLIKVLKLKNVAALGIKLKSYIETVPNEMIQLSNELNIPIIELPADCSWRDIIDPVLHRIVNENYKVLEKSLAVHNRLMKILLQEGGLEVLCNSIKELITAPVAIVDSLFKPMAKSRDDEWEFVFKELLNNGNIINHLKKKQDVKSNFVFYSFASNKLNKLGIKVCLVRIEHDNFLLGYLAVLLKIDVESLKEDDIVTLERACIMAALEIIKQRNIQKVSRKFFNEFLGELLEGKLTSLEEIHQRAHFLGVRMYDRYAVILVNTSIYKNYYKQIGRLKKNEFTLDSLKDSVIREITNRINILKDALIYDRGDYIAILLPQMEAITSRLSGIITELKNILVFYLKNVKIGIGEWKDLLKVNESYIDAYYALKVALNDPDNDIVYFNDLGILKFFIKNSGDLDTRHIREIYDRTLKPLADYDTKNKSDLITTLDTYFKSNFCFNKTAQKLFVHINTLRYRLEKIESLTGLSLKKSEDLFNLYLGLKIHFLLKNLI